MKNADKFLNKKTIMHGIGAAVLVGAFNLSGCGNPQEDNNAIQQASETLQEDISAAKLRIFAAARSLANRAAEHCTAKCREQSGTQDISNQDAIEIKACYDNTFQTLSTLATPSAQGMLDKKIIDSANKLEQIYESGLTIVMARLESQPFIKSTAVLYDENKAIEGLDAVRIDTQRNMRQTLRDIIDALDEKSIAEQAPENHVAHLFLHDFEAGILQYEYISESALELTINNRKLIDIPKQACPIDGKCTPKENTSHPNIRKEDATWTASLEMNAP